MKRRIPFLQKPVWGVSILMCSVAFVTMNVQAEPLVINPFPQEQGTAPATPPALGSETPASAKEEPVKVEEPVPSQADLAEPAVLGTPEAISARPHPMMKDEPKAPEPYYEFEPSEEATANEPKSEPAVIEDAPSPLEITTAPEPVAAPAPLQSASRELPPGVKVPEPGSSYFDAPAGAEPDAPVTEEVPVAAQEPAQPQTRYITEVPEKEAPVAAVNIAPEMAPAAVPENDITIESAGKAQDVNDAFEGGGIVVKSASGRASSQEIRRLAEQNQMPSEQELENMRPLASAPPPPQRMRMSEQLQDKANALVDENPMAGAADVAPVASSEPLSVSLQDIGQAPIDPAAPIETSSEPYVPYMAQKERGYVPQDEDMQREFEEIAPLPQEDKLRKPEPVLNEPVRQARSMGQTQDENVTRYVAPAEPVIEQREIAPAPAQPPMQQMAAPAAPEMQKPGLVYIRDGEVLDKNAPINEPAVREPVMGEEQVASLPASEDIRWESPRPENSPAMNRAPMSGRWEASEGMSVRQVLSQWCAQSGVRLIWDNPSDFSVKDDVSVDGAYEAAVQALLDQYQDDNARPLATLHLDPNSGERALVINVASS